MLSALSKTHVINAILISGWAGRVIVIILFIISIFSLAIFIKKLKDFRKIGLQNKTFLRYFRGRTSLEEFYEIRAKLSGPLLRIFEAVYGEVKKASANPSTPSAKISLHISSCIERAKLEEAHNFESYLVFLATAVVISPFLGLLGTVWGIMEAFLDIKTYGSAHISITAPGLAEALVTTVIGLCVAIPAVIFYNYLTNRASKLTDQLDVFSNELMEELKLKFSV